MSTLNLSFFKKNLMGTEACSASLTTEFLDVFSETELENKMLKVLGTIKSSVEVQVNCKAADCTPVVECKPIQAIPAAPRPVNQSPHTKGHSSTKPASESQINLLINLASKRNISIEELAESNNVNDLYELSSKTCNDLIQRLKA